MPTLDLPVAEPLAAKDRVRVRKFPIPATILAAQAAEAWVLFDGCSCAATYLLSDLARMEAQPRRGGQTPAFLGAVGWCGT